MEALVDRRVVIALAIAGAVLSTAASMLQVRGRLGERGARNLNYAGYALMFASMVLFMLAGIRHTGAPA
jgi:high-affinity Fe2+/Pb2+ permease